MLYLPRHFEPETPEQVQEHGHRIMRENPFATLIGTHEGDLTISHLPILLSEDGTKLEGHLAVKNPHANQLRDEDKVTAIFHGPHAYVTPTWYAENDVPTWNYAVAHVSGRMRWVREHRDLLALLLRMTRFFESGPEPWKFALPDDLKKPEDVAQAIIGFEIAIDQIQAKLKLSQNRSEQDRAGVIRGLKSRGEKP